MNKDLLTSKIQTRSKSLGRDLQQPQPYAMSLPDRAGALPIELQNIARSYLGAQRQAGQALLDSARCMAEARAIAQHGEWQVFLEATNTSAAQAKRLLDIHRVAQENPAFGEAVRTDWLRFAVAADLAQESTPAALIDTVLNAAERPTRTSVQAAKEEIKSTTVVDLPAAPGLTDILLRLDAHGYAKTSTRQKGSTIYHSFRDYRGDHEESGGELELAEGELSFWLAELDDNARRALARQEQFLDMQQRFAVFDWNLRRENKEFGLYKPNGGCAGVWKNLDQHMRQLNELERSRANRIARGDPAYAAERAAAAQPDPTILHLPMDFTDAQKRAAKIDLFIAMDMNGMFSIKNAGGSGVAHIAEWASLLRHLAYSEQAAAEIAAERAARQAPAPAAEPSEPNDGREDVRKRVIDLLTRLEPLMKWLKAEDIEGLSQAINDLNECEEGTEAEHWLKVGYALLDLEKD